MDKPLVGIIMGSTSDLETMRAAATMLQELGRAVRDEGRLGAPHARPDVPLRRAGARGAGCGSIIAGAGGAAHLPGMLATKTQLPVIGVPVESKALKGLDSLLSIAQMPAGVPVATMAIGGAANAALFAARILALDRRGARPPARGTHGAHRAPRSKQRSCDPHDRDPRRRTTRPDAHARSEAHGLSRRDARAVSRIRRPGRSPTSRSSRPTTICARSASSARAATSSPTSSRTFRSRRCWRSRPTGAWSIRTRRCCASRKSACSRRRSCASAASRRPRSRRSLDRERARNGGCDDRVSGRPQNDDGRLRRQGAVGRARSRRGRGGASPKRADAR